MIVVYIIASFEYSPYLEATLKKLEEKEIKQDQVIALPLDRRSEEKRVLESVNLSAGSSGLDYAFFLGLIFMLLGTIYGFVLTMGPVIWGLIGLAIGFLTGILVEKFIKNRRIKKRKKLNMNTAEVFLAINCKLEQKETIEKILLDNGALAIGHYTK
ncbi:MULTISPECIES: hypothetical protein [Bacillaceae]|uniref:Uncharacterized protein n=1 Tax=Evansella alkalicola TaxID=745819 RepID=A0ABS6K1V9_9BACI|nr:MULTISPECIES: hypothetical protein [Bacillaceae]MBU9724321.1 hypothetical protein [Bacillus alkalicola]